MAQGTTIPEASIAGFRILAFRFNPKPTLLRQRVVNSLHVPVHAKDIAIRKRLAGFANNSSILLGDWSGEWVKSAGSNGSLCIGRHLGHVFRHIGVGRHCHCTFGHAFPGLRAGPRAIHRSLDALHVIGSPAVDNRRELRLGRECHHV